jgi:hypothetical protein
MPFQAGNNYSEGRPPGAVNKRSEELRRRLRDRGDKDPADFLSAVVTSDQEPKDLRVAAANMLLPYLYSKRGATAEPPALVFVEQQVKLPHPDPKTITHSRENIAYLTELKAQGQIDLVAGDNLIADQYKILSALVDEAKIAIQGGEQGEQVIRIEGGLPTMPGLEELIMPKLNGHSLELQAIESEPPAQAPDPDSTKQESGP